MNGTTRSGRRVLDVLAKDPTLSLQQIERQADVSHATAIKYRRLFQSQKKTVKAAAKPAGAPSSVPATSPGEQAEGSVVEEYTPMPEGLSTPPPEPDYCGNCKTLLDSANKPKTCPKCKATLRWPK